MTIGEALKQERLKLGLTQEKFSEGVVSAAHYSRIERDINDLSAYDLLAILKKNHISYADFFNEIDNDSKQPDIKASGINFQLIQAFYHRDKKKVLSLNEKIQNSASTKEEKLRAVLITANVTGTIEKIPNKTKKEIKRILFEDDDWTENELTIRLFANSLLIFSKNEFDFYMNDILDKYVNAIGNKEFYFQKVLATLCVDALYIAYYQNDKDIALKTFKLICNLPEMPEFFIYKMLGNYYRALFNNNIQKCKEIRQFMTNNGLPDFVKTIPQ